MSNGTDQRIRHVAIVLQSLDAGTSRRLLAQLPPAQSKSIRQAMVHLGAISPQERNAAFESMKGLLGSLGVSENVSGRHPNMVTNSEPASPASELLAASQQRGLDAVELSGAASSMHASISQDMQNGPVPSWHFMSDETLADILQSERPIVIATVLNQIPIERATALVQLLPLQVAGATLAAVPHIGLTDAAILKDIEVELERKLSKYEPQQKISNEGLSRLQAIIHRMPETQKDIWMNAIAQSNPVLASKMGWSRPMQSPPIAIPSSVISDPKGVDEIFEQPNILPFPNSARAASQQSDGVANRVPPEDLDALVDSRTDLQTKAAPLSSLARLSDRDFVTVLHSCPARSVLLAISGAPKEFVARVERLVPPRDVARLRAKLTQLGPISLQEVDEAQTLIADTAERLLAIGKIGALENVTFTAAA
jgi:flagellar motor switch protein FliG